VHQKSVLIRGVTFGEIGLIRGVTSLEDNLVVFYHLVHQKSVLIRGVTDVKKCILKKRTNFFFETHLKVFMR
jgi:hypothetical protein